MNIHFQDSYKAKKNKQGIKIIVLEGNKVEMKLHRERRQKRETV